MKCGFEGVGCGFNLHPNPSRATTLHHTPISRHVTPKTRIISFSDHIKFHHFNIKNDSCLKTLVKASDLTINLAAICTPADYNTRPLGTIYNNFIDAIPVMGFRF